MRPKNFRCPFKWEERRPLIFDRVLFVPEYYDRHQEWTFPGWESPEVFGRRAPIEVEYCTGNGAWIIEKARTHPERNWVAVECQFERVRKIWSKMHNEQIKNLFIICGEALTFTRYYVQDESFSAIYVNFPDPWPKEKHAKKRLLQEPFIGEMARVIKRGGVATLVTDHPNYMIQISQNMLNHLAWKPVFSPPYYVTEWEDYGSSYFEQLWREQGVPIHYLQFYREKI
jgi:tRNA (guanine-N7-)-methyltransferase